MQTLNEMRKEMLKKLIDAGNTLRESVAMFDNALIEVSCNEPVEVRKNEQLHREAMLRCLGVL